jgi:hypothetical protein
MGSLTATLVMSGEAPSSSIPCDGGHYESFRSSHTRYQTSVVRKSRRLTSPNETSPGRLDQQTGAPQSRHVETKIRQLSVRHCGDGKFKVLLLPLRRSMKAETQAEIDVSSWFRSHKRKFYPFVVEEANPGLLRKTIAPTSGPRETR